MSLEEARRLLKQGRFHEALEILPKTQNSSSYAEIKVIKSKILDLKGEFEKSLETSKEAIRSAKQIKNPITLIAAYSVNAFVLYRFGNYDDAMERIDRAEKIFNELDYEHANPKLLENIATIKHLKGNIFHRSGSFQYALHLLEESLAIRKTLGNKQDMASSMNKIAIIKLESGLPEESLKYSSQAHEILKELNNLQDIAYSLNVIGRAHQSLGEYESALECYATSLNFNRNIGNDLYTSRSLYDLVTISLDMNDIEEAKKFTQLLHMLSLQTGLKIVKVRSEFCRALTLKAENRTVPRAEAQTILKNLASSETFHHNLTALIHINLGQLLLEEWKVYKEQTIFNELKQTYERLYLLASDEQSYSILIDTMIIQSKINLLEGNIQGAMDLLESAEGMAVENKLISFRDKVRNEIKALEIELEKWNFMIEKNASIKERIEKTKINQYLKDVSALLRG